MEGIDLGAALKTLYASVNMPLMIVLTGAAFGLHRLKAITPMQAVVGPIVVGAVVGILSAVGHATTYQGGYVQNAQLAEAVLEGAIFNGLGSVLIGRGVSVALDKMGIWPADGQTPPTAPKP